jgi:hypothetical protein
MFEFELNWIFAFQQKICSPPTRLHFEFEVKKYGWLHHPQKNANHVITKQQKSRDKLSAPLNRYTKCTKTAKSYLSFKNLVLKTGLIQSGTLFQVSFACT